MVSLLGKTLRPIAWTIQYCVDRTRILRKTKSQASPRAGASRFCGGANRWSRRGLSSDRFSLKAAQLRSDDHNIRR